MPSWPRALQRLTNVMFLFGILPGRYSQKQHKFITNRSSEKYMLRFTIIISVIMEFFLIVISVQSYSENLSIYGDSKTSNKLVVLQLLECVSIQLSLSVISYVLRHKNVRIVQTVEQCSTKYLTQQSKLKLIKKIYLQFCVSVFLILLFLCNLIMMAASSIFSWVTIFCILITFSIYFTCSTIYFSCFICLQYICNELLQTYNNQLTACRNSVALYGLLQQRNIIIEMYHEDLSVVLGLPVLLQSCFILSCISTFIFVATVMLTWSWEYWTSTLFMLMATSLFSLPPLIVYANILMVNSVDKEVEY